MSAAESSETFLGIARCSGSGSTLKSKTDSNIEPNINNEIGVYGMLQDGTKANYNSLFLIT
jgi:hypothetical protein